MRDFTFKSLSRRLAKMRLNPKQIKHLEDLERMGSVGIRECAFMSCRDERDTDFEREMDGKTISLKAARKLVLSQIDDIPRAVLKGKVEW